MRQSIVQYASSLRNASGRHQKSRYLKKFDETVANHIGDLCMKKKKKGKAMFYRHSYARRLTIIRKVECYIQHLSTIQLQFTKYPIGFAIGVFFFLVSSTIFKYPLSSSRENSVISKLLTNVCVRCSHVYKCALLSSARARRNN